MKVKFLIAALFFSLVAAAQPSNYIKFNTRGRWIAGMFDSTLHVPRFNGSPSLRTGGSSMDGAIAIDTTNGIFYFYQGGSWKRANLDTSAYAVTSVYRKTASDSVFYVKGGVHTFAFKDSTGGGTPTFQQVLTAGSTLTGNNTIDFNTNTLTFNTNGGYFDIETDDPGNVVQNYKITGEPSNRLQIQGDGLLEWGDGTGADLIALQRWKRNGLGLIDNNVKFYIVDEGATDSSKIIFASGGDTSTFSTKAAIYYNNTNNRFGFITGGNMYIDDINYTLSTTGKKILIRDTATGLVQNIDPSLLGASSYTFTNGLTDSSGTVKLGGTLTEHTTIDGNNKIFEYVDGNSFTIGVTDQIQILSNANGFETNSTSATIKAAGTGKESMIIVSPDSIAYNPHLGVMRIDTLAAASNMTNKRVMTWDTVTKRWEQIAKDSVGGGGSTSPAGNYGNLQLNRNGAFATPASDSLDFTTGLDIKGHVNVSATSTTGIQFGGTTRIYNDGTRMRISPSGGEVQFYTAGTGNLISVINSGGSNSVVMNGQTGQIYRSSDGLQIQTTGNVGIGSGVGTTSTARLHISAGTASANTAPFKLTSGTNLTTPEAGAMEYNGTNLFFTPSSAARNNILMTASVNSVSPTSPNRTITVVIDGTTYYIHAKTTND